MIILAVFIRKAFLIIFFLGFNVSRTNMDRETNNPLYEVADPSPIYEEIGESIEMTELQRDVTDEERHDHPYINQPPSREYLDFQLSPEYVDQVIFI